MSDNDYIMHIVRTIEGDPQQRFIDYQMGELVLAIGKGDKGGIRAVLFTLLYSGMRWKEAMAELKEANDESV